LSNNPTTSIASIVRHELAAAFSLPEQQLFGKDMTLNEIISACPSLINSVDFMECCARVANGLRKSYGVAVRVPATSGDTPISTILASFLTQLAAVEETQS
jgi:hypothetical protein